MNKLFVIGNLVKDPETRATNTGKSVCSFTLAVNRASRESGEEPEYFKVNAWGKLGESCGKWLSKGRKVSVIGSVSLKRYETKSGEKRAYNEIYAEEVEFLPNGQKTPQNANEGQSEAFTDVSTDDIPF